MNAERLRRAALPTNERIAEVEAENARLREALTLARDIIRDAMERHGVYPSVGEFTLIADALGSDQ